MSHHGGDPPSRRGRLAQRRAAQARLQRRRVVVGAVVVLAVLLAGSGFLDWWTGASDESTLQSRQPPATDDPSPTPTPTPEPTPTPTRSPTETEPPVVLQQPGEFPTAGPGEVAVAEGGSDVFGEAGQLRRYRVAVERDSGEDAAEFAEFVDETLSHDQGWASQGEYQFQRVSGSDPHDFTIYLVTSETAASMCAAGGLVVIAPGLPEGGVSCRLAGQVILNLSRWRQSVPHYVDAEVPLEVYRQMVLNHEVGHELGYGHFGCPGSGEPAPVMQQQSIRLDGCEANPWPYLDGRHHTGPPAQ